MTRTVAMIAAAALAIGCGKKGAQHSANLKCISSDAEGASRTEEASYGPEWCASTLEKFLLENPHISVDDFSVYYTEVGDARFAKIVLLYRGDLVLKDKKK